MNRLVCCFGLLLVTAGAVGCNDTTANPSRATPFSEAPKAAVAAPVTSVVQPVAAPVVSESPGAKSSSSPKAAASSLRVKRLVVTTGVQDREPVATPSALMSDGSPIYAFAELSNPDGESENVRVTFERKGGSERVGNVTLPVPGKVSRHRTWATTRFIRAEGVWEAVLWSEGGSELGRTSFEVSAPTAASS